MDGICGADCKECELLKNNKCKGCKNTEGCPFGKKCWIASYIEIGGKESFDEIKRKLLEEINALNIEGMVKIQDLYPLKGEFVNLEYTLPNGIKVRYLEDDSVYLGTQVECDFSDEEIERCFGVVANMNFILVCEYGENGINPELILYKKR